jgi:acetyl-CoA carboxylase carboxyl transferase subunit alpha
MKVIPLEFEKPIVELEKMLQELKSHSEEHSMDIDVEVERLEKRIQETRREIYENLTPWQRVQIVRHPRRPFTLDYLKLLASDFVEISGDRFYGNDKALIGGFATIGDHPVMVVGHQKGRDTKENLRVPIVAVVLGEGGSGGALGIGVADRVLILENAYYSVISPEGCAAILWKDRAYAPQAASALKMSAQDLRELHLVDDIIPEPMGGAHHDWETAAQAVKKAVLKQLKTLGDLSPSELVDKRYEKFRAFGEFAEK